MSTLTAITDKLRSISPELEGVIAVLQVIQSATQLGGPAAAAGLRAVDAALRGLEDSASGALTHEQLMLQMAVAHDNLRAARASENADIDSRFPSG